MLGLEVNAGAGGFICQQREESVKDTGCFNTPVSSGFGQTSCKPFSSSSLGHFWQHAHSPQGLAHQNVAGEYILLAGAEPPVASRALRSGTLKHRQHSTRRVAQDKHYVFPADGSS